MKLLSRLALSALPLVPAVLHAAPYNPAAVAADARWVVHADVEALRTSTVGRELIAAFEKAQAEQKANGIGLNVPKLVAALSTLTAYGTNLVADPQHLDGTLVAQGAPELRKIAESILLQGTLAEAATFSEVTDLPFPAYAISDPKAAADKRVQVIVAFPPEPIILVSKSKTSLQKALAVHRGTAAALAKASDSPLTRFSANAAGAVLFAASTAPADVVFPENAPHARVLQLTKAGSFALGEKEGMLVALAELTASSDRNAEKLHKILEGLTAMLSLAETNDRQLAEFLNSTKVTRDNDLVRLKVVYPTDRLVAMTQAIANPPPPRKSQPASLTIGKAVAEWTSADASTAADGLVWRTVENVSLTNGTQLSVGSAGKGHLDRIEIMPAGGGTPLVFRRDMMQQTRNQIRHISFPGADGAYTLKVAFTAPSEGTSRYAVSVRDPREAPKKK